MRPEPPGKPTRCKLTIKKATDESITEETTVRGSTGILSKLKEYFIENTQQAMNDIIAVEQYKSRTPTNPPNPVHPAWVFQAYLKQVATLAVRIELLISRWTEDKIENNGDRTASELEELRTDMLNQLSHLGESWGEANNDDGWLQPVDATEEKKALARTVSDARLWGQEALRKIRDFRDESTVWERKNAPANSQREGREGGIDAKTKHVATKSAADFNNNIATRQGPENRPRCGGNCKNAVTF